MGATRRLNHYDAPEWQPLFIVAGIGAVVIMIGFGLQLLQIYVSIRDRNKNRDLTGDPWNGRTLEWSTTSPPPFYNFAFIPEVHERDAWWVMKHVKAKDNAPIVYEDIHMPKNTPMGFYIGAFSFVLGFALIWWMYWLAIVGAVGIVAGVIAHLYQKHPDYHVPAAEVEQIERRGQRV